MIFNTEIRNPAPQPFPHSRWGDWAMETFRRNDPTDGPDTYLVVLTRGDRIIFGAGLDETTALERALATEEVEPLAMGA